MWLDDKPTALYRLYDEAGTLLYVGISHQPEVRFEQHAKLKEWWPRVTRREVEWFGDRPAAARAEADAVRSEDPEFNSVYSPRVDRRTIRDTVAEDGVREVSLTLARPRLTSIVRSVAHGGQAVILLNHGRPYAAVVSPEFYERALTALGEERVLADPKP